MNQFEHSGRAAPAVACQPFHVHTPSEHRLDGQEFPAEAHFVHRGPNGELAVVGVFIEEGSEADELTELWSQLPQTEGESRELSAVQFDEQALLPDDAEHYLYPGSLTTPPCTEGVTWMVMNEPIEMSAEQISSLESVMGTSNRPVQPLGLGSRQRVQTARWLRVISRAVPAKADTGKCTANPRDCADCDRQLPPKKPKKERNSR